MDIYYLSKPFFVGFRILSECVPLLINILLTISLLFFLPSVKKMNYRIMLFTDTSRRYAYRCMLFLFHHICLLIIVILNLYYFFSMTSVERNMTYFIKVKIKSLCGN